MKISIFAQASSVDVAWTQAKRRGSPGLRPKDWEHLEEKLAAACRTLRLIDASRGQIPPQLMAELEGSA